MLYSKLKKHKQANERNNGKPQWKEGVADQRKDY